MQDSIELRAILHKQGWKSSDSYLTSDFLAHLCSCTVGSYASPSICPSVCLSVCLSVSCVTYRLKATNIKVKDHIGQGQIRIPKKGRWAHNNVKLLNFSVWRGHITCFYKFLMIARIGIFSFFSSSKVTCSLSEHWCRSLLNTCRWWRHTRLITSTRTPASDSCVNVCLDRCRVPSRTARPCRLNSLKMMISLIWLLLR